MVNNQYLQRAHQLGRQIASAAIWQASDCTWPDPNGKRPMDGTLYEGTAGVGWFLAHLTAATGDPVLKRTANGAAHHALAWARTASAESLSGLHSGKMGTLWAVAATARVLQNDNLASQVDALLPHELSLSLNVQVAGDVISGEAGTLLALVGLARLYPVWQTEVRDKGIRLAELMEGSLALLSLRQDRETNTRLSVGIAHGTSGVVWAFLELYDLTRLERFLELARRGLRYERAWFDRLLCTWRDPHTRSPLGPSWCNGSVGIGLTRLRVLCTALDMQVQAEAGAALASTHAIVAGTRATGSRLMWEQTNGSACHGLMGMADMLLFAAQTLGVVAHRDAGQYLIDYGQWLANQANEWPCGTVDGTLSYGLMLGLSGIGTVLLRYADIRLPPVGLVTYSASE